MFKHYYIEELKMNLEKPGKKPKANLFEKLKASNKGNNPSYDEVLSSGFEDEHTFSGIPSGNQNTGTEKKAIAKSVGAAFKRLNTSQAQTKKVEPTISELSKEEQEELDNSVSDMFVVLVDTTAPVEKQPVVSDKSSLNDEQNNDKPESDKSSLATIVASMKKDEHETVSDEQPSIEISEAVDEDVVDGKRRESVKELDANMQKGLLLANAALIEIEQQETSTKDANKGDVKEIDSGIKNDDVDEKAKKAKKMEAMNKVTDAFKKCNEGSTMVMPDKDYMIFAQKVFRSTDVSVASVDDPVMGKSQVVSKGSMKWIDNNKKMSFFDAELLKTPKDAQAGLQLAIVALSAAKEKGWGNLKITVANETIAGAIRAAAEQLDIKNFTVNVKTNAIAEKATKDFSAIHEQEKTINGDSSLSKELKAKELQELSEIEDAMLQEALKLG
jgi:hypothetical protein